MKFLSLLMIAMLLLASCAGTTAEPDDDGDDFVASETAQDAKPGREPAGRDTEERPLSGEEEGEAALMIVELENATDQKARDGIIERIIDLGPRYLPFLRDIESDAAALDLMYIVRRIEREHDVVTEDDDDEREETTRDRDDETEERATIGNGGEDGPTIPDYAGDGSEYDRVEVEKFLSARLAQARRMLNAGRFDSAIRIAEAAIILLPDSELRPDFDALILEARGESQAELMVAGTLSLRPENVSYSASEKAAPFKKPLEINCFLKNVSNQDITLRLFEGEGKESVLELIVTYEQLDFQGNAMSQRGNVRLPIDAGSSIALVPNESYAMSVPLEGLASLDSDAPLKNALGRVRIEAALRVYGADDEEGEPIIMRPIRFPAREVLVFPSTYELEVTSMRPMAALREAIDDGEAQELFMSAHLIGKRDRREAGDLLFKDFDESTLTMRRARLRSLSVVFEVGRNWDITRWREWWDDNRLRQ